MSKVVLITGLSGVGKTTLSKEVKKHLRHGYDYDSLYLLDGDVTRQNLYPELGFSKTDREKNLKRTSWLANYLAAGSDRVIVLMAYIAPYPEIRDNIKDTIDCEYKVIYLNAPLETLKERDPKGLYKKALNGEIKKFTGITDPYIPPQSPDLLINTNEHSIEECTLTIRDFILGSKW